MCCCTHAGMLAPFAAGAAIILPAGGRFSATMFWRDAVEFGATFYTAVPTMHQARPRGFIVSQTEWQVMLQVAGEAAWLRAMSG